jgi:hypothetical protein
MKAKTLKSRDTQINGLPIRVFEDGSIYRISRMRRIRPESELVGEPIFHINGMIVSEMEIIRKAGITIYRR